MTNTALRAYDLFERRTKEFVKPLYKSTAIGLARIKRSRISNTTCIGITGSSGKTTTKDLIHDLLCGEFISVKSDDTNNQVYSVARAILSTRNDTQYLVQEIGASATDDMNAAVQLLRPDIGVFTIIGLEHRTKFRSPEAIASEKSKLVRALPRTGTAVINADDEYLRAFAKMTDARIITFGSSEGCDLRVRNVSSRWPQRLSMTLEYEGNSHVVQTQFCGLHVATCVLAALATSLAAGVSMNMAISRIEKSTPTLGRMMPHKTIAGITFIRDDWKAPWWSIQQPIEFMKQATATRKVIIIGTISDIPGTNWTKYRSVAEMALEVADMVFFYGSNSNKALKARSIPSGKTLLAFKDFREFTTYLNSVLTQGDLVLLKGSGSDHLARVPIMFNKNLACWRQRCTRVQMCDGCRLVSEP